MKPIDQLHFHTNTLILDHATGQRFRINSSGHFLLSGWMAKKDPVELLQAFSLAFGLTSAEAERDYHRFSQQWVQVGYAVPCLAPQRAPASSEAA